MSGTITLRDGLTINVIEESISQFRDAISRWSDLTIDAMNVKEIDIAAVQMLVAVKKEYQEKGKRLVFRVSDAVSNTLSLTGIQL